MIRSEQTSIGHKQPALHTDKVGQVLGRPTFSSLSSFPHYCTIKYHTNQHPLTTNTTDRTHQLSSHLNPSTMPPNPFAVVAGVGPGTGAAAARRFAKAYPVVLLARNPDSFNSLVEEINNAGGKALGISTDVSSEKSVKEAFEKIKSEHNGANCAAAIFNASGKFSKKPFLEMNNEDWYEGFEVSW